MVRNMKPSRTKKKDHAHSNSIEIGGFGPIADQKGACSSRRRSQEHGMQGATGAIVEPRG